MGRHRDGNGSANTVRRREVPARRIGDKIVVARPLDGAPVVLAPTATIVWESLSDWTSAGAVDRRLEEVFPDVPPSEREAAIAGILRSLTDDDLLD